MLDFDTFNARMSDAIDRDLSADQTFPEVVSDPVLIDLMGHLARQATDEIGRINSAAMMLLLSDERIGQVMSGLMVWCAGAGYASGAAGVADDLDVFDRLLADLLADDDGRGDN